MELVALIRGLVRHPLLLAPGILVALLAGLSMVYRVSLLPPSLADRTTTMGTATAQVLLSTADTLPDEEEARIAITIADRGTLVADLAATEVMQRRIAQLAKVPREQLVVFGPASGPPAVPVPLAKEAAEVANVNAEPMSVRIEAGTSLPIITVRAVAPDAATAARLAEATRAGLMQIARARSEGRDVVRLQRLGPVSERTHVDAPKKPMALVAFLVVGLMWCGAVAAYDGLRHRRTMAARGVRLGPERLPAA